MLKFLLTFCFGLVLGALAIISSYLFVPRVQQILQPWLIGQPKTSDQHASIQFNDHDEGQKQQSVDYIDEEEYRSTEGNSAELFKLKHGCKIKVTIVGETFYAYHVVYFHQKKLQHMQTTEYRTSWMQAVSNPTEDESQALYNTTMFNPQSALSQTQFKTLLSHFDQKNLVNC
jgi:hypothetical protein